MHPTAPNPRARCPAPALGSGLTLIELMIVLVITAILAAVAYPSYLQMLYKSRRADAMAGLGTIQQAQERYRSNSAIYQATLADLVGAASTTSPSGYYTLTIVAANATGYTLRATADSSGKQAGVRAVAQSAIGHDRLKALALAVASLFAGGIRSRTQGISGSICGDDSQRVVA